MRRRSTLPDARLQGRHEGAPGEPARHRPHPPLSGHGGRGCAAHAADNCARRRDRRCSTGNSAHALPRCATLCPPSWPHRPCSSRSTSGWRRTASSRGSPVCPCRNGRRARRHAIAPYGRPLGNRLRPAATRRRTAPEDARRRPHTARPPVHLRQLSPQNRQRAVLGVRTNNRSERRCEKNSGAACYRRNLNCDCGPVPALARYGVRDAVPRRLNTEADTFSSDLPCRLGARTTDLLGTRRRQLLHRSA